MAKFFENISQKLNSPFVITNNSDSADIESIILNAKAELNEAISVYENTLNRIYELQNQINDLVAQIKQKNLSKFSTHPIHLQQKNRERELCMLKNKLTGSQLESLIAKRSKEIEDLQSAYQSQKKHFKL